MKEIIEIKTITERENLDIIKGLINHLKSIEKFQKIIDSVDQD